MHIIPTAFCFQFKIHFSERKSVMDEIINDEELEKVSGGITSPMIEIPAEPGYCSYCKSTTTLRFAFRDSKCCERCKDRILLKNPFVIVRNLPV